SATMRFLDSGRRCSRAEPGSRASGAGLEVSAPDVMILQSPGVAVDRARAKRIASRHESIAVGAVFGHHGPQVERDPALVLPVARIAERHFVVANAVAPKRGAHVQVAGNNGACAKALTPVFGQSRAAPERESRNPWRPCKVVAKWPVIGEH